MKQNWKRAYIIAAILDGIDFIGGFIPGLGDVADVFGILLLFPMIGKYALINVVEFIPGADFLPTYLASVYMAQHGIFKEQLG